MRTAIARVDACCEAHSALQINDLQHSDHRCPTRRQFTAAGLTVSNLVSQPTRTATQGANSLPQSE